MDIQAIKRTMITVVTATSGANDLSPPPLFISEAFTCVKQLVVVAVVTSVVLLLLVVVADVTSVVLLLLVVVVVLLSLLT